MKLETVQSHFGGDINSPNLLVYIVINIISVISGQRVDDIERLCATEPHLRLRRFHLERHLNSGLPDL